MEKYNNIRLTILYKLNLHFCKTKKNISEVLNL